MSARLSSTTDAFQSQINAIQVRGLLREGVTSVDLEHMRNSFQEKIKAIDSKIEILDTEVDMEEETVVKTVQQFNKDFLKFTEQLREVDLLKQKYEKSCSDNIAETKKLRRVFKLILARSQFNQHRLRLALQTVSSKFHFENTPQGNYKRTSARKIRFEVNQR